MNKTLLRSLFSICKEYRWALVFFLATGISQTFIGLYAISYFQRLVDGLTALASSGTCPECSLGTLLSR